MRGRKSQERGIEVTAGGPGKTACCSVHPQRHGLGISRRIGQITRGTFLPKPGSLLPALHRMEEAGWLLSSWGESENNAGMTPASARREAILNTGGLESVKEEVRAARHGVCLERLAQDVRYGLRGTSCDPGVPALA